MTPEILGTPVSDRDGVRSQLGYLPEEPPVFDELTGREQLQYTARLRDIPPAEADQRIDEWLDRFDLAVDADRRIDDYSKGMRQKLGLIVAVLHEPAVVFLDEPTSGLDPRAARTVLDVIAELCDAGRTVFLSTHILSVVEELADTVGVLFEGELVAEGPPDELTAQVDAAGEAGADAAGADGTLEDVFLAVTTDAPAAGASGGAADRAAHGERGSSTDDEGESAVDEQPAGR
ncbi:MAG: ABC transporter ATP-binding protein [Halohasta sp.]